jgi:uncharacterized protein
MAKRILLTALLFVVCFSTFGQVDKEYSKKLQKVFELSGTEGTYQAAIKQIFIIYKQQYSTVEPGVWDELEKEFLNTSVTSLTEMLAPVYAKYLTIDDLQELIKFYETPIGKKYAQSTPLITQESMQIGQQWGVKLGQDFEKKMKEKGY